MEMGKELMDEQNASNSGVSGANDKNNKTNIINGNGTNNYVRRRRCNEQVKVCEKKKKRDVIRRVSSILRKTESNRTAEDIKHLETNNEIVKQIAKRKERLAKTKERVLEKEDAPEVIELKAKKLAEVLSRAQHLVCYTGAGISTSARIPDYRGSQGIWTLLQQGKEIGQHDLSLAEPTLTHMALYELHKRKILRYVLSQNCDGLHLRSGLPRKSLSEIHGNMYIEVCKNCKPNIEYWRLFDTTELTARYYHKTNRRCHFCLKPLHDTIVHFGERGSLKWPLNWDGACKNAEKADVILCLGSSLKVLKKYTWLWAMDRPKCKRPKVYIVNLQWTPKDKIASLKINGKCDEVMKIVMNFMNINVSKYNRTKDPIFMHASLLATEELHTVSQPMLKHYTDDDISIFNNITGAEIKIESDRSTRNEIEVSENNTVITSYRTDSPLLEAECKTGKIDKEPAADDKAAANAQLSNDKNETDEHSKEIEIKLEPTDALKCVALDETKDCIINEKILKNDTQHSIVDSEKESVSSSTDEIKTEEQSADDCDANKEKILHIQQQLNQLIVLKQTAFLLHHSSSENNKEVSTEETNRKDDQGMRSNESVAEVSAMEAAPATTGQCQQKAETADGKTGDNQATALKESDSSKNGQQPNEEEYYKSIINYYKMLEDALPHWYDVNYAYSGLHSIIHPPPSEVDIWGSIFIPIFHLNRNVAECDFCFDNYAEDTCQFYQPHSDFMVEPRRRNGELILCECCDFSDAEDTNRMDEEGHTNSPLTATTTAAEDNDDDDDTKINVSECEEGKITIKRAKFSLMSTASVRETAKIQPGWYGKGYRKLIRRKKRKQYQLP